MPTPRRFIAAALFTCLVGASFCAAQPEETPKQADAAKHPANKEYKAELARMMASDQAIRKRAEALGFIDGLPMPKPFTEEWRQTDEKNLARLRELIKQYGWPDKSVVGQQGAMSAFLIVQHADLKTQQELLPELEKAVERKQASPGNLAYLVDRIRLREGKKQLYGSQIEFDATGQPVAANLEDPEHVDERRKSVGLPPLESYLDMYRQGMEANKSDRLSSDGPPPAIDKALQGRLLAARKREIEFGDKTAAAGYPFGSELPADLKAEREKMESELAAEIRQIIETHGWPGYSLVGKDGSQVMFTNFRRLDKEFRRDTLPKIAAKVKGHDYSPKQYAFLVDETRVALGEKQVYGTQVKRDESGKVVTEPIEDAEHVDERRAEVNLGTLEEYLDALNAGTNKPAESAAAEGK